MAQLSRLTRKNNGNAAIRFVLRRSSMRYKHSASRAHFLKKFLPFILWVVFQKHTICNDISIIYTVLFFEKQTSFYGWRHRYKPFHLSPSMPVMQKVSRQTWNSLRLSMIFATKNSFSQILENKPPFLKFKKRNSLCQHSPTLLPCSDKDNWCLTPRMDEAKYFLGLCFTLESFFKILKNKTPFIVSVGTPLFLDGVQKTPFSQV